MIEREKRINDLKERERLAKERIEAQQKNQEESKRVDSALKKLKQILLEFDQKKQQKNKRYKVRL